MQKEEGKKAEPILIAKKEIKVKKIIQNLPMNQ